MEEKHIDVVSIKMATEMLSGLDKRDTEHAVGCYVTTQAPGLFKVFSLIFLLAVQFRAVVDLFNSEQLLISSLFLVFIAFHYFYYHKSSNWTRSNKPT